MSGDGKALVTKKIIEDVLTLITEGYLLRQASQSLQIPISSLYRYLKSDPETWASYKRAREIGADAIAEYAVEIADTELDAKKARNRIQVRQWLASKLDPKTFGDKLDLTVTQTIDLAGAIAEGKARSLRPMCDQLNVVDAEIVDKSISNEARPTDCESVNALDLDIFK